MLFLLLLILVLQFLILFVLNLNQFHQVVMCARFTQAEAPFGRCTVQRHSVASELRSTSCQRQRTPRRRPNAGSPTPLMVACVHGHLECVDVLLGELRARVSYVPASGPACGRTALSYLCEKVRLCFFLCAVAPFLPRE